MSAQVVQLHSQPDEMTRQILEIENTQKVCQALMKTPHYAKMGQEGIYAIVSKAKSMGISPVEALNGGFYFVNGKVGMSTETMACLIRQKGHSVTKDPKSNNEVCILNGKRGDNGDTWTISFSMDDARKAGLAKNMYDKYPSIMLYNRAMSCLARQLFPDVIHGAGYTLDELMEISQGSAHIPQEVKEDPITESQAFELKEIFAECDPEYKDKVLGHLKKASNAIDRIEDIPVGLFERIKNAALKKADEYQEKLKERDALMEDGEVEVINE